ncbi:hypothetical protein PVAND_006015 [Polypedilum vanderplanki]|uniref:F-box domain-containing protein n=1 Tax=Polypedilum vanderplanki TaxID=319348 RepID=A0A9J6C3Q0_POLVA|nr:hypothetical protein PVAND_006015 [Polypedilum vanderplanki]
MTQNSNLPIITSSSNKSRNFPSFPRELTSIIFQNLHLSDKLSVRESCTRLHHHIDDHFRRKFIQWMRKLATRIDEKESLHDDILLLSIEQYVNMNFTPPLIEALIELTEDIARCSCDSWHDVTVPIAIEKREKLLKIFYERANEKFTEVERKILFILTLLQMLNSLSSTPLTIVHPFNRKANLRLTFKIQNLFFAIPFYQFIFDWFQFDSDWIGILLLFIKCLEMRAARIKNERVAWTKMIRPMFFKNVSIIVGSENCFRKSQDKKASSVNCTVLMSGSREMIESLKTFLDTGKFDYEKIADEFSVNFEFSCPDSKKSNLRSLFFIRIYHKNDPSNLREEIQ